MTDDKIYLIYLSSQEEIMGKMVEELPNGDIKVKSPMAVDEEKTEQGSFIILRSYIPYQEEPEVIFKNQHIVSHHEVHPVVVKFYELSHAMSKLYDANRLLEIEAVNDQMFERLASFTSSNTGYVHKGSTSLN